MEQDGIKPFSELTNDERKAACELKPDKIEFAGMGKFNLAFTEPIGEYHLIGHHAIDAETNEGFVIVNISPDRRYVDLYSLDPQLDKTSGLFYNIGEHLLLESDKTIRDGR